MCVPAPPGVFLPVPVPVTAVNDASFFAPRLTCGKIRSLVRLPTSSAPHRAKTRHLSSPRVKVSAVVFASPWIRFSVVAILGVFFLLMGVFHQRRSHAGLLPQYLMKRRLDASGSALPAFAISVSGASRSPAALKSFASSLLCHVIRPASTTYGFHALVWMQDSDAEMMLCNLLDADVTLCLTRQMAVMTLRGDPLPSGSKGAQDEAAAIAADHSKEAYGAAWIEDMSFNTLRMLHKLRGVEYLRERALAAATDGSVAGGHLWVLRVRPDLVLHSRLPLPPPPHPRKLAADDMHEGRGGGNGELTPAVSATAFDATARQLHSKVPVLTPWLCHAEELCSDQWMLLSPAASAHLATLYEPSVLRQTMSLSSPPSLYPERLVWKLLAAYSVTPLPSAPEHHLLAADGIERDAYAKLKRDFPSCFRQTEAITDHTELGGPSRTERSESVSETV